LQPVERKALARVARPGRNRPLRSGKLALNLFRQV
jgi:hypothetical protein